MDIFFERRKFFFNQLSSKISQKYFRKKYFFLKIAKLLVLYECNKKTVPFTIQLIRIFLYCYSDKAHPLVSHFNSTNRCALIFYDF